MTLAFVLLLAAIVAATFIRDMVDPRRREMTLRLFRNRRAVTVGLLVAAAALVLSPGTGDGLVAAGEGLFAGLLAAALYDRARRGTNHP